LIVPVGSGSANMAGMEEDPVEDIRDEAAEASEESFTPAEALIVVATEGEETSDGRVADLGSLSWRTPPLSLTVNHDPNQRIGRIDVFRRVESLEGLTIESFKKKSDEDKEDYGSGPIIVGLVSFNLNTEFGREAASEVNNGFLTGVSMEVGDEVVEYDDNDVLHLVEGKIGAVTLTPFQAIESARVVQTASAHLWEGPKDLDQIFSLSLVASSVPTTPPAEWFVNPDFVSATPIFVEDTGRVFGHLALWDTCHTGRPDMCLTPPRSSSNYTFFQTGYVSAAAETGTVEIPVGSITMATGHASTRPGVSAAAAIAHYEHTGFVVADVTAGEDEYGIWVAGALRSGVTSEQIREFRGASLSGDWRNLGGNLELVAALAVNVPGFPVPRVQAGLAASGAQTALVAAGANIEDCGCSSTDNYETRIAKLEAIADILGFTNQATERLSARIIK